MDRSPRHGPDKLWLRLDGQTQQAPFEYQLAGRRLSSALEFPHLGGYRAAPQRDPDRSSPGPPTRSPLAPGREHQAAPASRQVFSGTAFVGGRHQHLSCQFTGRTAALRIEKLGSYRLDLDAMVIDLSAPFPETEAVEQALCGPCLPLLLAASDTFLLHASAVRVNGGIVALTGCSGDGKSTLGAELAAATGALPVADDCLPLESHARAIRIPGGYPQPKWPAWGAAASLDPPAELLTVVELAPGGEGVGCEPMEPTAALLAAARHTVAARLFDPVLLKRHFRFCRDMAGTVPFFRLRYRRQLSNLPAMIEQLSQLWARC